MYVTEAGFKKLRDELDHLKKVRRLEVAERLHNAIDDGADVLENAEYEKKQWLYFYFGRVVLRCLRMRSYCKECHKNCRRHNEEDC